MDSYLDRLRKNFPGKCDAQLELMISASRRIQQLTGYDAHTHRRRGMEMLFPNRIWHEWRDMRIKSVQECLEGRIQELMWIGSSNSNKSADMADAAVSLWLTKPELTTVYVASPYETATETGVWAYILEQFDEAKANNPGLPGKHKRTDNAIVHHDRNPRSFIRIATVDQIGKLVGKKARDFSEGLLVLILDELPAFTESAAKNLLRVMPNLLSVPNLLVIGAGNFAWVGDALGVFCDPDEKDIPGGYDGFDADLHHRWRTKRKGLCLRFDGLQSPNVKAGRDIYPFLTTIAYIEKFAASPGGLQSPDAMRFVRSAPVTNLDEYSVTTAEKIKAGGCYDPYTWAPGKPIKLLAFVDPGFGGDPCILQKFKYGTEVLPAGGHREIVALWDAPIEIPIKIGLKDANGVIVTPEEQVVRESMRITRAAGIPDENVGYDGSMRAGIVQKFTINGSPKTVAVDSEGGPTSRPYSATEKNEKGGRVTWKDKVDRLVSEFWFFGSLVIDSQQLRGLELSPKAVTQMTTRRWKPQGKKKRLQTKLEYKEMLKDQGKHPESPNEADALLGGLEIARRLGFQAIGFIPSGGAIDTILSLLRKQRHASLQELVNNPTRALRLPTGSLHSMSRGTAPAKSGTLNRQ